ncbi:hypothetical protein [Aliikangiella coralliicola]|uniref:Uncharacterized protein n=1 Tax=Aliikangiella coralliicola TaxID=2592383 RepID=A0A545UC54_9GAMM|nr:hypothetical protein [Aliikangiella coralliicola]TQV87037.1 hypothetical protein FLL46_14625 [Aliikangiella coralliicola]
MPAKKLYRIANTIIVLSIVMMASGAYVGFIDHEAFSIPQQVIAHISIMLGAGFLKLSYVMHLNASKHLGINDFSPGEMEFAGELEIEPQLLK